MNVSFRLPSTSISKSSSAFARFPRVFSRSTSSMSITSRAPSRSTIRLARPRIGHSAQHRRGVARQKIHQHLKTARRRDRVGWTRPAPRAAEAAGATSRRWRGRAFAAACRAGGFVRRRFFVAPLLLDGVLAQLACFGEEPPVYNLEAALVLLGISHLVALSSRQSRSQNSNTRVHTLQAGAEWQTTVAVVRRSM